MTTLSNLHPTWRFCTGSSKGLHHLSQPLTTYLLGLLQGHPISPPDCPWEDWNDWLQELYAHRLTPFVYHQFRCHQDCTPPEPVVDAMRTTVLRRLHRAELAQQQLLNLVEALEKAQIPVLALKGPALAHTLYPFPGARPFSDLDLLVADEDVPAASKTLASVGYQNLTRRHKKSRYFYADEIFVPANGEVGPCNVELHWDLCRFPVLKRGKDGVQRLFERSVDCSISGRQCKTLCPPDALLYRAMNNAFNHDYDLRLIWILDAALLAQSGFAEDWETVVRRSVNWKCRLALEFATRMAEPWFGLVLPESAPYSTWPSPTTEEARVWKLSAQRHEHLMAHLGLFMNGAKDGLHCLRHCPSLLFPDPCYMKLHYPPATGWHLPMAYIRRLFGWSAGH